MPGREEQIARIKQIERIKALEAQQSGGAQSDTLDPQVEALRQQNLQSGLEQSASPATRMLQGLDIKPDIQAITSGNIPTAIAGGVQVARKAASAPFTLMGAGNEASAGMMNQIPGIGPALAGVARLPMQALGGIGDVVGSALENQGAAMGLTPEARTALIQHFLQTNPEQAQYINQAGTGLATDVGTAGAMAGIGAAIGPVRGAVGGALETGASRLAGKAMGAGENFMRTRQLGKFAQEHSYTLSEKGYLGAKTLAQNLNDEVNAKIIDPATQAGVAIDPNQYIGRLQEFKQVLENRAVPDRASIMAIDRMILSASERAARSGGTIPVDEAQKMKVENNQILHDVYDKMASGGNITERGTARKAALVQQTEDLRSQLEQVHPELKNVNWHEGQALELKSAIYDYLNRTARGEGGTGVVVRAGGKVPTLSIYDLLKIRPLSSRIAVLLGKVGRGISGNAPDIVTGVQTPFQAPLSAAPTTAPASPPIVPPTTPPAPPVAPAAPTGPRTPTGVPVPVPSEAQIKIETPAMQAQAAKLGLKYEGYQKTLGHQFADYSTGGDQSSFYKKPGETVEQALKRHKSGYDEKKVNAEANGKALAQKALDKFKSGAETTVLDRNLIRRFFPDEAKGLPE